MLAQAEKEETMIPTTVDFSAFFSGTPWIGGEGLYGRIRAALSQSPLPVEELRSLKEEVAAIGRDHLAAASGEGVYSNHWALKEAAFGLLNVLAALDSGLEGLATARGQFSCALDYRETTILRPYSDARVGEANEKAAGGFDEDPLCIDLRRFVALCDEASRVEV